MCCWPHPRLIVTSLIFSVNFVHNREYQKPPRSRRDHHDQGYDHFDDADDDGHAGDVDADDGIGDDDGVGVVSVEDCEGGAYSVDCEDKCSCDIWL